MTSLHVTQLKEYIRTIHDFPRPGLVFRDITPLLASPDGFRESIRQMAAHFHGKSVEAVAAAEARGLVFAAPLALELNVGLLPVRKPVPIPFNTHAFHYELSPNNQDALEDYQATIKSPQRILFVDDLLASGTSTDACCRLIEDVGGTVAGCAFLIELKSLRGRERLAKYDVLSLIEYA